MDKRNSLGMKLTLWFCSVDSNALGAVIVPALAVIAAAFPGENVSLLVALPPLFIIPASLITGKLAYYVSRKTLLTIGQILYIIGGVGAAWFTNFDYILIMRVILGIGCGIVYPIIPTLIAQYWQGQERAQMLGRANAVGGLIAMTMTLIAGVLATIGWHLPFYIDLFFVLVLVMQLIFLPKMPAEKDMPQLIKAREEVKAAGRSMKIDYRAWLCVALMFVTFTIGMVYLLKMAIFIAETGLGDSVSAGLASSFTTGASFILAFTFPFAYKRIKRYTVLIPLLAAAFSTLLFYLATNMTMVLAGAAVFGFYLGYVIPYLQNTVSGLVHPVKRTFALAVLTAGLFAGQACSTPFVSLIESFVGTASRPIFGVMTVSFLIVFLVTAVYLFATRNIYSSDYEYATFSDVEEIVPEMSASTTHS
ncbi:MAG: MFS transporter [Actinobacteria bacterium]|nr:MFS transporter [Actinomycetota bacterium]